VPVLDRIKRWLDAEQAAVLPRSPMAAAITYAQNQWQALCTYATQGYLAIDNNASERALKRVAIGRKNWLFAGNDAAAENHARLWSLIASSPLKNAVVAFFNLGKFASGCSRVAKSRPTGP